jgi:hypothetical protein
MGMGMGMGMGMAKVSHLALTSIAIGRLVDGVSFGPSSVTPESGIITDTGERVVKLVLGTSRLSVVIGGIGLYDYV